MTRRLTMAAAVAALVGVAWMAPAAQQPADPRLGRPPAQGQAAPTGRITGRVLDAATGRPMRLVLVRLASETGGRTVQTDEAGVFDFADLVAGRFTLRVQKSGYVSLAYGQRRPLQPGTPIQLDAGQHLKDIEFRMPRGSVVSGTVADELGEPMPGIAVRVMRFQYAQGTRELVPAGAGQTDDRGVYRIWGLDPGEYYVSATARNFSPGPLLAAGGRGGRGLPGLAGRGAPPPADAADIDVGYAPTYFPGVPSVFEAAPVSVGLGAEVLDINFNVLLVKTARISGHALNADGTPVTAGNVNLAVDGVRGRGGPGANFGGRIRWDGAFAIASVPPGRYLLRARGTDDTFPQFGLQPIVVAGEDMADLVVTLAPGASLAGSIAFETTRGTALPDLTQVRVVAQAADPTAFGGSVNARADKDGRFAVQGIAPGAVWIRAQAPRGWLLKSAVIGGQDVIDTPIEVRAGQAVAGASLLFTDRQTGLTGTVRDGQGRPITDLTVIAFPTDSTLWRPQARQIVTARPDQNGRFELRGLPAGDYYLAAIDPQQPGEWFDPAFLQQQTADAARVAVADGATGTHDLRIGR